eukprot:5758760-Pyramimonas_sp.AAC.1
MGVLQHSIDKETTAAQHRKRRRRRTADSDINGTTVFTTYRWSAQRRAVTRTLWSSGLLTAGRLKTAGHREIELCPFCWMATDNAACIVGLCVLQQ